MINWHNQEMQAGLNSDLQVHGRAFHVQTEDWGWENPFIVTKIFCQGAVVKSVKATYQDVLNSPFADDRSISEALEKQHLEILDRLITGHL